MDGSQTHLEVFPDQNHYLVKPILIVDSSCYFLLEIMLEWSLCASFIHSHHFEVNNNIIKLLELRDPMQEPTREEDNL